MNYPARASGENVIPLQDEVSCFPVDNDLICTRKRKLTLDVDQLMCLSADFFRQSCFQGPGGVGHGIKQWFAVAQLALKSFLPRHVGESVRDPHKMSKNTWTIV